jgi:hypothetical protein
VSIGNANSYIYGNTDCDAYSYPYIDANRHRYA